MSDGGTSFEGEVRESLRWIKSEIKTMKCSFASKWVERFVIVFISIVCSTVLIAVLGLIILPAVKAFF